MYSAPNFECRERDLLVFKVHNATANTTLDYFSREQIVPGQIFQVGRLLQRLVYTLIGVTPMTKLRANV